MRSCFKALRSKEYDNVNQKSQCNADNDAKQNRDKRVVKIDHLKADVEDMTIKELTSIFCKIREKDKKVAESNLGDNATND